MMGWLTDIALAAGASAELSLLVKVTLVSALGLAGSALARRVRASRRYLVFAGTFLILVALPLAAVVMPPVVIPVSSAGPVSGASIAGEPLARVDAEATGPERPGNPAWSPESGRAPKRTAIAALRGLWVLGVVLFVAPVFVMMRQVRTLRRTGVTWADGEARATHLARASGVQRRITLLLDGGVEAPMTCGLRRPVILLPCDAPTWSPDDLDRVLLHELEHVRRADWLSLVAARVTCALYWFHPLVWITWRGLHREAERACDDAVADGTDRHAYAAQLVTLARRLSPRAVRHAPAMAGVGDLSHRVRCVLNARQSRGRAGAIAMGTASLAVIAAVAGIAPLKAVSVARPPAPGFEATPANVGPSASVVPAERSHQSPGGTGSKSADGQVETRSKPSPAAFEVASVKQNTSGKQGVLSGRFSGARLVATNIPLQTLVLRAYGIDGALARFLLIGGTTSRNVCTRNCSSTEEILTANFDVNALAPDGVPVGEQTMMAMLRTLLAERFRLRVRQERRDLPIYALTLAREGQLGPKLRRSSQDCTAWAKARATARTAPAASGAPMAVPSEPRSAAGVPLCTQSMFNFGQPDGLGIRGAGELVRLVGGIQEMDRPIVDQTGLSGMFEWELIKAIRLEDGRWLPPDAPPLDVALREQLGLRLEPRTAPLDVLVVESVAMPTPD